MANCLKCLVFLFVHFYDIRALNVDGRHREILHCDLLAFEISMLRHEVMKQHKADSCVCIKEEMFCF